MNTWRTIVDVPRFKETYGYDDSFILLGSCFAAKIYSKLKFFGFDALCNPVGIVYNPVSLEIQLKLLLGLTQIESSRFISYNNYHFHFDFHSSMGFDSKSTFQDHWETSSKRFREFWAKAPIICITLGTSWVYEYEKGIVANCHKRDKTLFEKKILSVEEIINSLQAIVEIVSAAGKKVLFTVSPIRHVRDGIIESQLSKAHLISALHQVLNDSALYFPSYEIMIDDLRDYRFYKDDLLHPNSMAVDYIWSVLKDSMLQKDCDVVMNRVKKYRNMESHSILLPHSDSAKAFQLKRNTYKKKLMDEYPNLRLD